MPFRRQDGFTVRFDWGPQAIAVLAPLSDVVVVVDVLRFTTAVDAVVAAGGAVIPQRWRERAGSGDADLSPVALAASTTRGSHVLLPSPNGAELSLAAVATGVQVLAGCLRNAPSVADAARRLGTTITVVAAGERWPADALRQRLRICLERGRSWKPWVTKELHAAAASFGAVKQRLPELVWESATARELRELGFGEDVRMATEHDSSSTVPLFRDGAFSDWSPA